jgi:NADH:ubiquinone oxidoreductase subunit E
MNTERVTQIIDSYGADRAASLAVLQEVQQAFNYLPREALELVAERLALPLSEVYHLATFYRTFSLTPKGKYCIRVCMGTACHVHGGTLLLEQFERLLKIKAGETTPDGNYSLEATSCLGACAQAPIVMTGSQAYPQLTTDRVAEVIEVCNCGLSGTS